MSQPEPLTLMQSAVEKLSAGILIIHENRVLLANPAALSLLNLPAEQVGQLLTLDGPDGLFTDRLTEIAKQANGTPPVWDYHVAFDADTVRTLELVSTEIENQQILLHVSDVTSARQAEQRWKQGFSLAVHDLKTPLAVMSLALSSLLKYYDRYAENDRREVIEEMWQQVQVLTNTISAMMKNTQSRK